MTTRTTGSTNQETKTRGNGRPHAVVAGRYVVRLRRAVQQRLPNKPPPHPAPARSSATGTTTSGAERTARDRTTSPANPTPPRSTADVLNTLPPALADYIQDLSELSGAPIDYVALVVLRAVGSLTADGLSEQARAELEALVSGQVVKTGLTERGAQTGDLSVAGPNTRIRVRDDAGGRPKGK